MRPFVFRAQVALDLRRKREEDAQRELAAANAAVQRAEAELRASVIACDESKTRAADALRQDGYVTTQMWYRNWINRQQREIAVRRDVVASRRAEADGARAKATKTHIDVRVLENLRDKKWRAYTEEERRAEQKEIDWLAVLRTSRQADSSKECG